MEIEKGSSSRRTQVFNEVPGCKKDHLWNSIVRVKTGTVAKYKQIAQYHEICRQRKKYPGDSRKGNGQLFSGTADCLMARVLSFSWVFQVSLLSLEFGGCFSDGGLPSTWGDDLYSLGEHQRPPRQAQKLPGYGQVLDCRIWDNPEKIRQNVGRKSMGLISH